MCDESKRYWNAKTQRWECGNEKSDRYEKASKDQSGKPCLWDRMVSRLVFGGPEDSDD